MKRIFPWRRKRWASGMYSVMITAKLFNLANALIEWQVNNEIKENFNGISIQTSPEIKKRRQLCWKHSIALKVGDSSELERFAPVMTPDVLCETDVEGAVTFFAIWCGVDDEEALFDGFGWSMMICAFSLTTIVVSTLRDCPRGRCCGNEAFWSLDATLNVFCFPVMIEFP